MDGTFQASSHDGRTRAPEQSAVVAIREGILGDFVETGVLRGGAAIFLRAILKAHGVTDRRVVACDTFIARQPRPSALGFRLALRLLARRSIRSTSTRSTGAKVSDA
jgi:hypothetical protein